MGLQAPDSQFQPNPQTRLGTEQALTDPTCEYAPHRLVRLQARQPRPARRPQEVISAVLENSQQEDSRRRWRLACVRLGLYTSSNVPARRLASSLASSCQVGWRISGAQDKFPLSVRQCPDPA